MTEAIVDETVRIGRFTMHGELLRYTCGACRASVYDGADLAWLELESAITVLREAKDIAGAELKQIRKCIGMTQRQVGHELGRTVETLSRQENDALPRSRADRLARLAIAMGVRDAGSVEHFIQHEASRSNRRTHRIDTR